MVFERCSLFIIIFFALPVSAWAETFYSDDGKWICEIAAGTAVLSAITDQSSTEKSISKTISKVSASISKIAAKIHDVKQELKGGGITSTKKGKLISKKSALVLKKSAKKTELKFIKSCKNQTLTSSPDSSPTPSPSNTPAPQSPPTAPLALAAIGGDAQAILSWSPVTDASSYNLYWSLQSGVTTQNGNRILNVANPYLHLGLTNGSIYYYIVTAVNPAGESPASNETLVKPLAPGASPYDPPWATITPTTVLLFNHNAALTNIQNGTNLVNAMKALQPGQKL